VQLNRPALYPGTAATSRHPPSMPQDVRPRRPVRTNSVLTTHSRALPARVLGRCPPSPPEDTGACPPVPRSECERTENANSRGRVGATRRSSGRNGRRRDRARDARCVKRPRADVLATEGNGSPEDTERERLCLGGPRIKHLRDLFVNESGARSAPRTLPVLTPADTRREARCVPARTRCYSDDDAT
jgi:hypothetical protein